MENITIAKSLPLLQWSIHTPELRICRPPNDSMLQLLPASPSTFPQLKENNFRQLALIVTWKVHFDCGHASKLEVLNFQGLPTQKLFGCLCCNFETGPMSLVCAIWQSGKSNLNTHIWRRQRPWTHFHLHALSPSALNGSIYSKLTPNWKARTVQNKWLCAKHGTFRPAW